MLGGNSHLGESCLRAQKYTGVDESDEGEDINKVDDHSDGDGVAQAISTVYSTFQCADSFQILYMAILQPMFTI